MEADHFDVERLVQLPCVVAPPLTRWTFQNHKEEIITIQPNPQVEVDDLQLALDTALKGLGIAYLPQMMMSSLNTNRWVGLRSELWTPFTRTMYAYYSAADHVPKRVSQIIEYIRRRWAEEITFSSPFSD